MSIRALFFDVFGTLVDWRSSLIDEGARLGVPADWPSVIDDWRRAYQPALDRARAQPKWQDFDTVHFATLDQVLEVHGVALSTDQRASLIQGWRRLRPWPDTGPGLEMLRREYVTATLSNGHVALLVDLARFGGWRTDAVLSVEFAESYKPDPRIYLRALELLECRPEEGAMVAAHANDLEAAAGVGMHPVLVRRPDEWGTGEAPALPATLAELVVVDGLEQLARMTM